MHEDIASKVVAAVASISAGVIARQKLEEARGKPPRDLSAYECTLRANEFMIAGFWAASHLAMRTCLEAAVASEPDYAAAWAMLAWNTTTFEFTQGMNKGARLGRARAGAGRRPPCHRACTRGTRWRASRWRARAISCVTSTCSTPKRRARSA